MNYDRVIKIKKYLKMRKLTNKLLYKKGTQNYYTVIHYQQIGVF